MRQITVFGGGSWGTALAHLLASAGHAPFLLLRQQAEADTLNRTHEHPRYLARTRLHPGIRATADPACLQEADLVVLAVPCQNLREALASVADRLKPEAVLVNTAKGLETRTATPPSGVVAAVCPRHAFATLSGPSFALEVALGKPTAVVLACADETLGARLRGIFATAWFRTYSSTDLPGVELGGAVKNVIAIASGISDGLGFGHNTRAALITRGLAEITRLGVALGAQPATFMGLSGMGDLLLTCAGDLSRNRQVGLALARGLPLERIVSELGMVAEGVKTTDAVMTLACQAEVEMPVTAAVYAILREGRDPKEAVRHLMERQLRDERG